MGIVSMLPLLLFSGYCYTSMAGEIPLVVDGNVVPLLTVILKALTTDYSHLVNNVDAQKFLYDFLHEESPGFNKANSYATKGDVERALKFLSTVLNEIVELCNKNKELITHLSKLSVKAATRAGAFTAGTTTKVAMKFVVREAASQSVKTVLKFTNLAGIAVDAAQVGLEATGYEDIGEKVGMWGNIGTAAVTGALVFGGPVGAPIGALVGLGTWLIGEAVDNAIDKTLS